MTTPFPKGSWIYVHQQDLLWNQSQYPCTFQIYWSCRFCLFVHCQNSPKLHWTSEEYLWSCWNIIIYCSRKYPYSPSHGRFIGLNSPNPLGWKFWCLRLPSPSKFPMTFHRVCMDIFWNCTTYDKDNYKIIFYYYS